MKTPYRVGATRGQASDSRVRGATRRVTLRNLFATLPGRRRDAAALVVSAHTDAWVHGAIDPVSGAATVLEAARRLSRASPPDGWRPERDVVFAFWDGEEYGMLGSTRWVEERLADLPARVAAFLYVDSSARALGLHGRRLARPRGQRSTRSSRRCRIPRRDGRSCPSRATVAAARASAATRRRSSVSAAFPARRSATAGAPTRCTTRATTTRCSRAATSIPAGACRPPSRASSPSGRRRSRTLRCRRGDSPKSADFLGKEIGGLGAGAAQPFPQKHELVSAVARFREAAVSWDDVGVAFRGARASDLEPIVLVRDGRVPGPSGRARLRALEPPPRALGRNGLRHGDAPGPEARAPRRRFDAAGSRAAPPGARRVRVEGCARRRASRRGVR